MSVKLPELPFAADALEPHISKRTIEFHYGKHHQAYADNLNKLIAGTEFDAMGVEEIIKATAGVAGKEGIFNNAAQFFNHSFFWNCLKPNGGGEPVGDLAARIARDFGSFAAFRDTFKAAAVGQFGSGWAWLAEDASGKLSVIKTANADTPVAHGLKPLLTVDVWEHAYYLDYQNRRADFVEAFLAHLANWG